MFQQFKSIFPNASLNIRSLTESVGINDTEWNRGIERLGALRNEFQNLNTIISNRLDADDTMPTQTDTPTSELSSITELKATGQLINKLQGGWDNIHAVNQDNFQKAREADIVLRQLQQTGELHYSVCKQLENAPNDIEKMHTDLESIQASAVNLMQVLSKIEARIDSASVNYEEQQFVLWKQEQEQELMDEINFKRQALQEKELKLKHQYEEYNSIQQEKRLELYEANFNAELEDYKRRRETEVSSLYSYHSNLANEDDKISLTLDQLKLDASEDLDEFLEDDIIETQSTTSIPHKMDNAEKKKKKKKKEKPRHALSSENDDSNEEGRIEILADEDYEDL